MTPHVGEAAARCPASTRAVCSQLRDIENAAADVRLQADDARAGRLRQPGAALRSSRQRHAELGVRAGGAHVMVMAAPDAGVDAHEDVAAAEQLPASARSA